MLTRIVAALGVGVWCIFILLVSVVFVIDRGLADVGIVWVPSSVSGWWLLYSS